MDAHGVHRERRRICETMGRRRQSAWRVGARTKDVEVAADTKAMGRGGGDLGGTGTVR